MFYTLLFEISILFYKFNSKLGNINNNEADNIRDKPVFPPLAESSQGYKILAVVVAIACTTLAIVFIIMLIRSYRKSKAESIGFGQRVKGELKFPGYNRGNPKPVIDENDKRKDAWGKIDDD